MRTVLALIAAVMAVAILAGMAEAVLPATISGYVTNADTGAAVSGAKVWSAATGTVTTAKNGAYLVQIPSGYITLCSVSTGLTATCKPGFTAGSGQAYTRNIKLAPK